MARPTYPTNPRLLAVVGALALAACVLALTAAHKPAQATFPGENGRIVFEGHPPCAANFCGNIFQEIYSVDPATAGVSNLTDTPTEFITDATPVHWLISAERWPRWSPDGEKILFVLDRHRHRCEWEDCWDYEYTGPEGTTGLYTMNPDGSAKTRISDYAHHYAWSPGGEKIAYMVAGQDDPNGEYWQLRTMNAAGSGTKKVFVPRRRGYVWEAPVWSPNGKKLAFVREERIKGSQQMPYYVHSIKADGSGHRKFALKGSSWGSGRATGLNWTPNGRRLIFGYHRLTSDSGGVTTDIFSVNPDGSRMRNLTDTPSTEEDVAWEGDPQVSPGGERVGFVKTSGPQDDPRYSFHTMDPDGSDPTEAFDFTAGDDGWVWEWSPDGKKIAFARSVERQSEYRHYIVTINVDGSGRKNIHVPNLEDRSYGIDDLDRQPLP